MPSLYNNTGRGGCSGINSNDRKYVCQFTVSNMLSTYAHTDYLPQPTNAFYFFHGPKISLAYSGR